MYRNLLKHSLSVCSPHAFISHIDLYASPNKTTYLCQCVFNIDKFYTETASTLSIDMPQSITSSVKQRQAQFIAGRYMAKFCLKQMDTKEHNLEIGSHREPIWPVEFIGAISHISNQTIAVVAKRKSYNYVGIDIENVLDSTTTINIATIIHNQHERTLFCKHGISDTVATSIIFSAKESLFKAVFPYIKKYFGFECARVIEVNTLEGSLILALDITLSQYCANKTVFKCYYFLEKNYVVTMILN